MPAEVEAFRVPPVVRKVRIALAVDAAFDRFTRIGGWWPAATHSLGGEEVEAVVLEGEVGGRLFERRHDGSEHLWGRVVRWDPPAALAFTWHVGREPDTAQTVALTFEAVDEATTAVTLVHDGWEALGENARATRDDYDRGWEMVLGRAFVGANGETQCAGSHG